MTEKLPDHWDPTPHEREWWVQRDTGERGYTVRRDGEDVIRENKVQYEVIHKMDHNWKRDSEHRPLNMAQLARVAFAADHELCLALGLHDVARKEWSHLLDDERMKWLKGQGPQHPKARRDLFAAIWSSMKELAK